MNIPKTEKEDRRFARARKIAADAEEKELSGEETPAETILRLAFKIADLEHAEDKDEYSID